MENMKRILDIKTKGAESATIEDIPVVFNLTSEFININPEVQQLIKGTELSMNVQIKGADPYFLLIENGNSRFDKGTLESPDFTLKSDLITIAKLLLGQLDATEAYFSQRFKAEGDLHSMITFLEILELAIKLLKISNQDEKNVLISPKDMKQLFEVYARGASTVQPFHIPLFFDVLTAFVNYNPEARDVIEGEDLLIQLTTMGISDYLIRIVNRTMGWAIGSSEKANIIIRMGLKESAEIILSGDAVSAFMAGKISVEGEIAKALVFQELIELFLEVLGLD